MNRAPHVLLIADMPLWSTGISQALRSFYPELEFVCASSGREAIHIAADQRFDVLVADLCLPDMHAFELLRLLREGFRMPPALLFGDEAQLHCLRAAAFRVGVRALLSRRASLDELREAMSRVLDGESGFENLGRRIVEPSSREAFLSLSARELEVLHGLSEGLANRVLGARLHMAETTLKTHLRSLFRKFGVGNRTACVAAARRAGLL